MIYVVILGTFLLLVAGVLTHAFLGYPLLAGVGLFALYAKRRGHSWKEIGAMVFSGCKKAMIVIQVLLVIGALTAVWISGGTIPFLVREGMRLIQPRLFILCAFLFCSAMSFLIGTSFGTANTIGIVLITIARRSGVNLYLTTGAIICGIYFGDRCSPMSSSLMLLSSLSGTGLYDNSRAALKSSIVPFLLASLCYLAFSFSSPMRSDSSAIPVQISDTFYTGATVLLPAALVFLLCLLKVPVKRAMLCSIATGAAPTLTVQGMSLPELLRVTVFGFSLPAGHPLESILKGGGILGMAGSCIIVLLSCAMAGIMEGTHMIDRFISETPPKNRLTLFLRTVAVGAATSAVGCNQTMAIVLTATIQEKAYANQGKRAFADDLSYAGTLVPTLLPWNIAVYTPVNSMGIAGIGYMPYLFWIYLIHLWHALRCLLESHEKKQTPSKSA